MKITITLDREEMQMLMESVLLHTYDKNDIHENVLQCVEEELMIGQNNSINEFVKAYARRMENEIISLASETHFFEE